MKTKSAELSDECKIHAAPARAVNRTLLFLILASLSLIVWHVWVYGPTGHTGETVTSDKPFLLLLGNEIWDLIFDGHGILAELQDIYLYFLFGILLAGFIRTYKLAIKLRNSLIKYGVLSIVMASFVGVLTPLCACGILTTAITLLFAGLPLAPVMALLVSSPLISPSSYLLTLSDLGPQWTVIRTVAAFSMGMFAGVLTHMIRNKGFRTEALFLEGVIPRGDFHDENYPDERLKCNCKIKFGNRVAAKTKNMFLIFLAKSSEMLLIVGKYVLVGIAVGSIIERYLPSEWIYSLFGEEGALNIVWITFGAVPIFLHQISASSILYHIKSTLNGTLDGGAGIAFLIGGPVTAIPTMTMLWAMFKKRVFFLYMFICLTGTILLSYSFQYLVFAPNVDMDNPLLRDVTSISGGSSAILTKADKNVQIVMDPGGHAMIATYENDLDGKGGIVFDAGMERFLPVSVDRYDNQKYIQNVAEWLEEHNSSLAERNILIYNAGVRQADDGKRLKFSVPGFQLEVRTRQDTPELTGQLLENYSQLWIFAGNSGADCCLTDAELEVLSGFAADGRSMLIAAGSRHAEAPEDVTTVNHISSRFGVTFSGHVENGEELQVSTVSYFFSRISQVLDGIYRFMK